MVVKFYRIELSYVSKHVLINDFVSNRGRVEFAQSKLHGVVIELLFVGPDTVFIKNSDLFLLFILLYLLHVTFLYHFYLIKWFLYERFLSFNLIIHVIVLIIRSSKLIDRRRQHLIRHLHLFVWRLINLQSWFNVIDLQ